MFNVKMMEVRVLFDLIDLWVDSIRLCGLDLC